MELCCIDVGGFFVQIEVIGFYVIGRENGNLNVVVDLL